MQMYHCMTFFPVGVLSSLWGSCITFFPVGVHSIFFTSRLPSPTENASRCSLRLVLSPFGGVTGELCPALHGGVLGTAATCGCSGEGTEVCAFSSWAYFEVSGDRTRSLPS